MRDVYVLSLKIRNLPIVIIAQPLPRVNVKITDSKIPAFLMFRRNLIVRGCVFFTKNQTRRD